MRVLHVGNIAKNAYHNAEFLRRRGVEADVLCYDYPPIMGQPEWKVCWSQVSPDRTWERRSVGLARGRAPSPLNSLCCRHPR